MQAFTTLEGVVVPLDRANVDTDAIIPKQFLKSVKRTGFGQNLFDEWRYLDHGEPGMDNKKRPINPNFVFNFPQYREASILLARENFGCGSSREHAAWALFDYGVRCILAPSYADIFFNNCFKNGILPIILDKNRIQDLFVQVQSQIGCSIIVDLPHEKIKLSDGREIKFEVESFRKKSLVNGLDDISNTLQQSAAIKKYEMRRRVSVPWLFMN